MTTTMAHEMATRRTGRVGRPFTPDEDDTLRRLAAEGHTRRQIADGNGAALLDNPHPRPVDRDSVYGLCTGRPPLPTLHDSAIGRAGGGGRSMRMVYQ
jgi:hypothetical protein